MAKYFCHGKPWLRAMGRARPMVQALGRNATHGKIRLQKIAMANFISLDFTKAKLFELAHDGEAVEAQVARLVPRFEARSASNRGLGKPWRLAAAAQLATLWLIVRGIQEFFEFLNS